jgi:hypothetical protein
MSDEICIDYPIGADVPSYAALVAAKKWPNGSVLKVRFLDGFPGVQARVAVHARHWSQFANITLDFGAHADAHIRISFCYRGSWSTVGTDALAVQASQPTMNYGWLTATSDEAEVRRVVLHEFGHALGLIHEHQNPAGGIPWDKEAVYKDLSGPPNNWDRAEIDFNMFQAYDRKQTRYTEVDRNSIMMYPIPAKYTAGRYVVGLNNGLSDTDRQFIAAMYPKS